MSTNLLERMDDIAPMLPTDRCQRIGINAPTPMHRSPRTGLHASVSTHRCCRRIGLNASDSTNRTQRIDRIDVIDGSGLEQGLESPPPDHPSWRTSLTAALKELPKVRRKATPTVIRLHRGRNALPIFGEQKNAVSKYLRCCNGSNGSN